MNFRGHVGVGLLFALGCLLLFYTLSLFSLYEIFKLPLSSNMQFNVVMAVQVILIMVFSALAPDVDHHQAYIRRFTVGLFSIVVMFISISYLEKYLPLENSIRINGYSVLHCCLAIIVGFVNFYVVMKFIPLRHRGITHTLIACAAYGILIGHAISIPMGIAATLGYLSHLIADQYIKVMVKL